MEKPDIVYVAENQPASITITLNHVHAVVTWKRSVPLKKKEGVLSSTTNMLSPSQEGGGVGQQAGHVRDEHAR